MNNIYGEPVSHKIRDEELILKGQRNFGEGKNWYKTKRSYETSIPSTGDITSTKGHILFERQYLADLGVEIKKNDKVVEIAGEPCDFLVDEVKQTCPLRGKNLFVKVTLADNEEDR